MLDKNTTATSSKTIMHARINDAPLQIQELLTTFWTQLCTKKNLLKLFFCVFWHLPGSLRVTPAAPCTRANVAGRNTTYNEARKRRLEKKWKQRILCYDAPCKGCLNRLAQDMFESPRATPAASCTKENVAETQPPPGKALLYLDAASISSTQVQQAQSWTALCDSASVRSLAYLEQESRKLILWIIIPARTQPRNHC